MTDSSGPAAADKDLGTSGHARRPTIDPALGLNLAQRRELRARPGPVSICVPAHNEAEAITEVVHEALRSLDILDVHGEVIVCASACTDDTASLADASGARVVECGAGKGVAIRAGLAAAKGEIIATVDGDLRYYGPEPITASLVRPILAGSVDATVADLYWRPLYPQLWFHGFFAPLAGRLFPEILGKVGTTPWSGQRAALRSLWPDALPDDFTLEMAINLAWNDSGARVRPVPVDDWMNPQRPKPDLIVSELETILDHAVRLGLLQARDANRLRSWFDLAHERMATYQPGVDDPTVFEQELLRFSLAMLPGSFTTSEPRR